MEIETWSSPETLTLNSLPDVILLRIFSFFSVYETLSILTLVCRRWLPLARDPSLRKHLQFYIFREVEFDIEKVKNILSISNQLISLKIDSVYGTERIISQVAKSCPNLRKLYLSNWRSHLSSNVIRRLIRECSELEELYLHDCWKITDWIFSKVYPLENLKILSINRCGLSKKGIENLFRVQRFPKLIHLSLCNFSMITFNDIKNIPHVLPKIKVLDMVNCKKIDYLSLECFKSQIPNLVINTILLPHQWIPTSNFDDILLQQNYCNNEYKFKPNYILQFTWLFRVMTFYKTFPNELYNL